MTPMKRFPILLLVLCLAAQTVTAQTPAMKVEDNSATPKTLLQVNTDAGLLVRGTYGTGVIPATGEGVRLMWYPGKAAFRAGRAFSSEWDNANIGLESMATGFGTTASGQASTAMGQGTTASGGISTALGFNTKAAGFASTAMGEQTQASGYASTAMGYNTNANGLYTTVMGQSTMATATHSVAIGRCNNPGFGDPTNWISTDELFTAGNGTPSGSGCQIVSNALVLYKNGNLRISGTLTQSSDARLKEDLAPLTGVLSRLERLQPTYYRFREGTNRPRERQIGLIAQQVERVFPELVSRGADGYLSVSYSNFSAVLVQAVKEQQQLIDRQQQEIEQLEAEVAALRTAMETRLAQVEAVLATQPASGPSTLRKAALSIRQDD